MKPKLLLALFALTLSLTGCKSDDDLNDIICTLEYVYGLNVTLIDAANSNKITDDVTVIATESTYEETLTASIDSFYGAGERAGTYIITVTSANYETLTSDPVVVIANECHVTTKVVEFTLQPK